jgi:hypothetical protein
MACSCCGCPCPGSPCSCCGCQCPEGTPPPQGQLTARSGSHAGGGRGAGGLPTPPGLPIRPGGRRWSGRHSGRLVRHCCLAARQGNLVGLGMAYNFRRGDRDQPFLLPPDLRDWLPEGHPAWFVLDVVDQLDLAPFYRAHRDDGARPPRLRPQAAARRAAVRLRDRGALLPAGRTPADRGRRLPRPGWQPGARPRDHRAVPGPPRDRAGRVPGRVPCGCARPPGWSGWAPSRWTATPLLCGRPGCKRPR